MIGVEVYDILFYCAISEILFGDVSVARYLLY